MRRNNHDLRLSREEIVSNEHSRNTRRASQGRFRWLPRESRGTAENSVVSPGKLPGDTMVVLVGQMGILSAHAWCGTSVKNTMEETIMKRMIYVNHAIL